MAYPTINLIDIVIDEVALEGLDGITLQALWLRLEQRLHNPEAIPKPLMTQIWSICVTVNEFAFCELQTARQPLVIFDRYEYVDPDLGIILEPDHVPPDIYPHCPIYNVATGVKGSCSSFSTRKDITEYVRSLTLDEATQKYGNKLVIVASQYARNHALMGEEVTPLIGLSVIQYCFLERVGRSRYHGEVTQGKLSLSALKEDPKSLFYHRKLLLRHKLITKQIHHQKSGGHSCNGSLLHLTRFFVERKPKAIFLAEEVIKILQSKPNCVAEYDEIKRKLRIENAIKKLCKTSFFQKIVKTDIKVPYRTLYPNAEPLEWQQQNNPEKEKKIKVVQLLLPSIDVADVWKDDVQEEDELHEINISNHKFCVPYMKQVNDIIEATGSNGLCQGQLAKTMGLTRLQSRTMLRNIVKQGVVATYMNDIGRQRLTKYVSKKFEKNSMLSKQFHLEMDKIKELTKQMITENDDSKKKETLDPEPVDRIVENVESKDCVVVTEIDKNDQERSNESIIEMQNSFHLVNRILCKYNITKLSNRYKRTSLGLKYAVTETKQSSNDDFTLTHVTEKMNEKAQNTYRNIKVNFTVLAPIKTRKTNELFGFMENVQNSEKNKITHSHITYRLLRRANMIIEAVKDHQVIDDMTKLLKMIHEEEDKEGYIVKIDKKSLLRLLQKLSKDNLVKNIKVTLSSNGRDKSLIFICDPSITVDNAIIQSAVEQAKLKFFLLLSQRIRMPSKTNSEKPNSSKDGSTKGVSDKSEVKSCLKNLKTVSPNYKCGPRGSKKYGYCPKFIRMQTLHTVLYYLVYEHPGEPAISKSEQVQILRNNDFNITGELAEEFSTIYTKDISWKMFMPPLPKYTGWPRGWTLMCDVLLRLPLSAFLKLHYIHHIIPDLDSYTNHPIRKHYLVRELPPEIRNPLLHGRKYIFNIHETMTRLCYIGLVQFGPQKLKEKDQVFIYVNRRSELLDTTSSAPGYHTIEDKPYPVYKYNFDELATVEKYWYDMWNTCISTPLGGRLVVQGTDIVLEDMNKKAALMEAVVARSSEEAVRMDTGHIPGDRKGAAGIDSACFAHLKRNWNWALKNSSQKKKRNVQCQRDTYLSTIKAKPIKFTEFSGLKKVSGPPSVNALELKRKVESKADSTNDQRKYEELTGSRSIKQKSYVRRVLPRKCNNRKKTKYDEVDYRALQRMNKLRVDWDPCEDKILLICKVAMVYLCPNARKQIITFSMVRDVLRDYSAVSHNKTSRACQRRLLYMLRRQQNVNIVALGVEEVKQNFFIKKRFNDIMNKLKEEHKSYEFETKVAEVFKSLVAYIIKKYYDISDVEVKEPHAMPATLQEFNLLYKVVRPTKPFGNLGFTKDVQNVNDVHSAVINSVIHSAMCCGKDRRSWAYQLFKVYEQYPEMLLRNAMSKIRSDQLVTVKKSQLPTIKKFGHYMPMSSSQYQLSSNYVCKFHTRWSYDLFKESYDVFLKLSSSWYFQSQLSDPNVSSDSYMGVKVTPMTGGVIAATYEYITRDQIDFDIEIPDQVIMLDPRLQEKDETYFRIAKRYQDVLVTLDNLNKSTDMITDLEQNSVNDTNQDGLLDLDTEKNEFDIEEKNFEDGKSLADYDENFSSDDDEIAYNVTDDNTIKFQDGTKIVLNKEDVERATRGDDDSAMETENDSSNRTETRDALVDNENCSTITDIKKELATRNKRVRGEGGNEFDKDEPRKKKFKSDTEANIKEDSNASSTVNKSTVQEVDNVNKVKQGVSNSRNEIVVPSRSVNGQIFTRVSDILKSIPVEQCYLRQYCKIVDSGDAHKKYTRLALLRMREELSNLTVADSHHAHEYFVVNMFKVYYSLTVPKPDTLSGGAVFENFLVPPELLPLRLDTANELINELNESVVLPSDGISFHDFQKNMESEFNLKDIEAVYEFVHKKKELGASILELMNKFVRTLGENLLYSIVTQLTKHRLLLRSGVTTVRYIHYHYADCWMIRSYKICRLERESLTPMPKNTVYIMEPEVIIDEGNDVNVTKESETPRAPSEIKKADTVEDPEEIEVEAKNLENDDSDKDFEDEENAQVKKRMQRKRTGLQAQKDISRAAKQLDLTTKEEIKVVIKPWIRIDGVLNRRVLDRMLGSILLYCLTHPGIPLSKIQNRFLPVLQPCHTRELVEILIKLKCLVKIILKKPRVTLFSKPARIESKITNNDWNVEEDIFVEPATGAMLKFSIFLSTKRYTSDYIK
ncbi:general transcription factor 3C polypeptide 1 [Augochlora pura]